MPIFRPRELRDDASAAEIRRQLNEIQREIARDLATLLTPRRVTPVQLGDYAAAFGDVVRLAPPSGGARLLLPKPNAARVGDPAARVTAVVEGAVGALTVEVVDGEINGGATLAYAAGLGAVDFELTPSGWFGWSTSLIADLPLTALASQAADTFVGRLAAAGVPAAQLLSALASTSIVYDATSHTFQRAALTSEVTASQDSNGQTVTRSTDFSSSPWTGNHKFEGQVLLGTEQTETGTGSLNVTLGSVVRLRFSDATGNHTIGTISGCADSRLLIVEFSGTGTHTTTHSTGANAVSCPGNVDLVITGRGGYIAVGRDASGTNNWKVVATTN